MTHVSVNDSALFIHLRLVVIVYPEPTKQYLVLVLGQCSLELEFGLSRALSALLHHAPERRVVEVVDVACSLVSVDYKSSRFLEGRTVRLSPPQIVA